MSFDIEINELEYKYDASKIKLDDYQSLIKSMSPINEINVESWDYYFKNDNFSKDGQAVEFLRYRAGKSPELTFKIKTNEKNNNDRIEVDLRLNTKLSAKDQLKQVTDFCTHMGFKLNFSVFKRCYIYFFEKVDTVYYEVFNEEMKSINCFIEVEARKDAKFDSKEEAISLVKEFESKLSVLGITPQHRMRRSLWEMYKR